MAYRSGGMPCRGKGGFERPTSSAKFSRHRLPGQYAERRYLGTHLISELYKQLEVSERNYQFYFPQTLSDRRGCKKVRQHPSSYTSCHTLDRYGGRLTRVKILQLLYVKTKSEKIISQPGASGVQLHQQVHKAKKVRKTLIQNPKQKCN